MIDDLKVYSSCVSWKYNEKQVEMIIEEAFWASKNEDLKLVRIEAGERFIANKVYFYTYEGKLRLFYDLILGKIEVYNQEKNVQIIVGDLKQVGYFPNENRIMVLCGNKQQELRGYNLEGIQVFHKYIREKIILLYFTNLNRELAVVCDCDETGTDEYGRCRYNYIVDINNGELRRYGLAY